MKIVVLDGYTENPGDLSWSGLEAFGEVKVYDRVSYEESSVIAEVIGDADIAITNKTPISKETIDKCPNLKFISVLATGYNVIDVAYAKEKGISVSNVPVYGTRRDVKCLCCFCQTAGFVQGQKCFYVNLFHICRSIWESVLLQMETSIFR